MSTVKEELIDADEDEGALSFTLAPEHVIIDEAGNQQLICEAFDANDTGVNIKYPIGSPTKFTYDFLIYDFKDMWYIASSNDPDFENTEIDNYKASANTQGAMWIVVDADTGIVVREGLYDEEYYYSIALTEDQERALEAQHSGCFDENEPLTEEELPW